MAFMSKLVRQAWLFFFAFGLINVLVLPKEIILKNDDFGYVDSMVRSLAEGRIVTGDFLEPFAISLTSLSVFSYKIGQNFWFATYGLLFLTQLVLWWTCWFLIREHFTDRYAALVTSCILSFPLILGKLHEFTSVPLYWVCFFGFIVCWPRRPFLAFILFTAAFGCRQSAITLLALPFLSVVVKKEIRTSLVLIVSGLAACATMTFIMEPSFAQLHTTYKIRESFQWITFVRSLFAFSLFALAGAGAANAMHVITVGDWKKRWALGPLVLIYIVVLKPWDEWIGLDMVYLGAIPHANILIFIGLASCACFIPLRWQLFRPQFVLLAIGAILLPSFRGAVWDYYGVEIAMVGALAVKPRSLEWKKWPFVLNSGVVAYTILCLAYAVSLWRFHDLMFLRIKLYEEALRSEKITIHEVSRGSFGYIGWKLFDSMVQWQKSKGNFQGLAAFLCETNDEASIISSRPSSFSVTTECSGENEESFLVVNTVQGKVLGRTETLDLLVPCSYKIPEQSLSHCLALGETLRTKKFPLNHSEWLNLIKGNL